MYTVIETGGFQYKVQAGDTVRIPLVSNPVGEQLEFNSVLLVSTGKEIQVGTPTVAGASVKAEILAHGKDKKVVIFKKKRRKRYQRKKGHRQDFTEVIVTEIASGSNSVKVEEVKVIRARARVAALAKLKAQNTPLTYKEKIAQGIPKPAKVKKNSVRKAGE